MKGKNIAVVKGKEITYGTNKTNRQNGYKQIHSFFELVSQTLATTDHAVMQKIRSGCSLNNRYFVMKSNVRKIKIEKYKFHPRTGDESRQRE